ncbi:MAG: SMI1/KNR4 family protein [Saprospiraceae bacterium]|nr:SMI1/KNR4 family protein [Saprospiraceae bacterium]
MDRIEQIGVKIQELKNLDKRYSTFGSSRHKYELNRPVSESEILFFEKRNSIQFPNEYRNFIKRIGNGGAGPYYGLERIERGKYADLDLGDRGEEIDLSQPFPFKEKWNLDNEQFTDENGEFRHDLKDKEYYKPDWSNGMLRIANFGCGVSINLIVNGEEFGNIWVDDRCNGQGILPFQSNNKKRIQFLDWYEQWLDDSLKPFHRIKKKLLTDLVESIIKEEWGSNNFSIRSYIYNIMDIEPPNIPHHKPEYMIEMERLRKVWLKGNL